MIDQSPGGFCGSRSLPIGKAARQRLNPPAEIAAGRGNGSFDSASLRSGRQDRNADTVGGGALDASPAQEQPRGDSALPSAPARAELDLSALTPVQRRIAEALGDGALQLDALIDKTGLPAALILPQLTLLQIKKIISQKPGKIYEFSGG